MDGGWGCGMGRYVELGVFFLLPWEGMGGGGALVERRREERRRESDS